MHTQSGVTNLPNGTNVAYNYHNCLSSAKKSMWCRWTPWNICHYWRLFH